MIAQKDGTIMLEHNEPVMRSCWECNPAHGYLKDVNVLFWCFLCEKSWIFGRYIDDLYEGKTEGQGDQALVDFLGSKGVEFGESTTKIKSSYKGQAVITFDS